MTMYALLVLLLCIIVSAKPIISLDDAFQTGSETDDTATAIGVNDDGIYVCGYTAGSLYQTSLGDYDALLIKLDHNYTLLQGIQWGTNGSDITKNLVVHPNENILYVSHTLNNQFTVTAFSTMNLSTVWTLPPFNSSYIWNLAFDNNTNSLWIVGSSYNSFLGFNQTNNGMRDAWLVQIEPSFGTILNIRLYGGSGYDEFYAIAFKDSVMYVAGSFGGNTAGLTGSAWLVSYGSAGNQLNSILLESYDQSYGSDIDATGDDIIILGWSDKDWVLNGISFSGPAVWIGSFDSNLTLRWLTYWEDFFDAAAAGITNGTLWVSGSLQEADHASLYDMWITLLDINTGQQMAVKYMGTEDSDDQEYGMALWNGNAWIVGITNGDYAATSDGGYDIIVQKAHAGSSTTKENSFPKTLVIAVAVAGGSFLIILIAVVAIVVARKKTRERPVDLPKVDNEDDLKRSKNPSNHYQILKPGSNVSSENTSPENSDELLPVQDRRRSAPMNNWLIDYHEIKLGRKIGQGAFGEVYKAKYRGSSVAVKQAVMTADDIKIQDFFAEAELMKGLRPHPNITQLLGVCTEPLCIVTEFVANGSLYSWLKSGKPLDDNAKFEIIKGTAAGMLHLHRQGVIHRDLAARNILLDKAMNPKVADFGLSRVTIDNITNKTEANIGPVKWMAPEALMERVYNQKTDVWSFGVVIYEVLTREAPYKDCNLMQIGAAVGVGKLSLIPEVDKREGEFSPVLVAMLKQCLQFKPKKRPDFAHIVEWIDQNNPLGQSLNQSQS